MGFLDVLGSIAVAGMDKALTNENFLTGVALSKNGDRKLDNLMDTRLRLGSALDSRRYRNTSPEPITGKQAAIGLGILAIVGIGAALLSGSNSENNNNNSSKDDKSSANKVATSTAGSGRLP